MRKRDPAPLCVNGECVGRAQTVKFRNVHLSKTFSWSTNTAAAGEPEILLPKRNNMAAICPLSLSSGCSLPPLGGAT